MKIDGVILYGPENEGENAPVVKAKPGDTLTVEITLKDRYEIWRNAEDGTMLWWEWYSGEYGWKVYPAGTTATSVTLPGEEVLEESAYLQLNFAVQYKKTAISSVTLNAPVINEGEGYAYDDDEEDCLPYPEVTVPSDAPYKVYYAGWVVPSDDPDELYGMGFCWPEEDATFEKGQDYYIYAYLVATDVYELFDKKAEDTRTLGADGIRLFSVDNPPEITVENGELVAYYIPYDDVSKSETRMIDGPSSAEMVVILKVNIPEEEELPPTSDMDPNPWVWTMVLTISAVLTAAYYEIQDMKRANGK